MLRLLRPVLLLFIAAAYLVPAVITSLRSRKVKSLADFQDAWFACFWGGFMGPKSVEMAGPTVRRLLGEVNVQGVCLDIGPGNGQWLHLYTRANVTKIYGVEPNRDMHAQLRESAAKAGLADVYQILPCGAQELGSAGIQPGTIDTIVTVQTLCSIPHSQQVIKELYPYLKPGGKWIVYEHVRTKYQEQFVALWQYLLNLVWPHFFNGCDLTRPTDEWLLKAGDWAEVKLYPGEDEGKFDSIPHVYGLLVKA
ncbi:S-adenosyl-L-methionine-dependent methyltransferase [Piedraia hortae CBS 480.64]|uniref:S-adenosyl-L-methionine-dependent methyltransferase n=1 Tax=Piedraia hortae CBS 480.64 TaxID=1314780 RepID=A0A6A7C6P4_9PEZI|nr:S-adenosyl-L-methionine-dependent methyltransferase [Piedraia hortae CBS 480.64]